jgi:hypothetical protein
MMSIYITRAFVKMRQTLQMMTLNKNNPELLTELLKQYNKIINKLEEHDKLLNKHDIEIKDLSKLINIIIQKMLPNTQPIKIKGFKSILEDGKK